MTTRCRFAVLVAASLAGGCGGTADADAVGPTAGMGGAAARYAVRSDWLVDKPPDVAPLRWNTPGFPPLKTLTLGRLSPDVDLLDGLRSELAKRNVINPAADLTNKDRADFARVLDRLYGTPTRPAVRVPPADELKKLGVEGKDLALVSDATAATVTLGLDDATLARGGAVYRRWCLHCHGPTGAGDGSNAAALLPAPRDYRQGLFKFVTSAPEAAGKPLVADLKRTVRRGLDGSMMPAFPNLAEADLADVVAYVIHLSVRGEAEARTMKRAIKYNDDFGTPEGELSADAVRVPAAWGKAQGLTYVVPPSDCPTADDRLASAARGFALFGSAGCAACHANYGRTLVLKYDAWGTVVQPRNLTLGVFRGGRGGDALYARLYSGIAGAGMPAHKSLVEATPRVPGTPDKIWDIVHFVLAVGDPNARRGLREKYGIDVE